MPAPRKPKRVNASYLKKVPTEQHQAFAEYIFNTTGTEVSNETVALVQRLYPLYLKSPAVVEAREKAKAEREAEARRKEEEKQRRIKQRLLKIEQQRAKLLADLGLEPTDPEPVSLSVVPDTEDPEPEEPDTEDPEPDDEPEAEEVTLSEEDEDDEVWGDDEDEEEDF